MSKVTPSLRLLGHGLTKWTYSQFGNESEIDVYIESTGTWETAARAYAVPGTDAEEIAALFVNCLNDRSDITSVVTKNIRDENGARLSSPLAKQNRT